MQSGLDDLVVRQTSLHEKSASLFTSAENARRSHEQCQCLFRCAIARCEQFLIEVKERHY